MPNALSVIGNTVRAVKGEETLTLEHQLLSGRLSGQLNLHKEFSYSGENLVGYNQWDGVDKTTLLISVVYTYTDGNITQKVITDEVTNKVVTVVIGYIDGRLFSVSESVS